MIRKSCRSKNWVWARCLYNNWNSLKYIMWSAIRYRMWKYDLNLQERKDIIPGRAISCHKGRKTHFQLAMVTVPDLSQKQLSETQNWLHTYHVASECIHMERPYRTQIISAGGRSNVSRAPLTKNFPVMWIFEMDICRTSAWFSGFGLWTTSFRYGIRTRGIFYAFKCTLFIRWIVIYWWMANVGSTLRAGVLNWDNVR